jgi:hypothetical protein
MFTTGAIVLTVLLAWFAQRKNEQDRLIYDQTDELRPLLLHMRQDLKLIAFLLGGAVVMLGIVADRLR